MVVVLLVSWGKSLCLRCVCGDFESSFPKLIEPSFLREFDHMRMIVNSRTLSYSLKEMASNMFLIDLLFAILKFHSINSKSGKSEGSWVKITTMAKTQLSKACALFCSSRCQEIISALIFVLCCTNPFQINV